MAPGENRWIGIAVQVGATKIGESLPVHLEELAGDKAANGVAIAPQIRTLGEAIHANLNSHRAVFRRAEQSFHVASAYETSQSPARLLNNTTISEEDYLHFLNENTTRMKETVSVLLKQAPRIEAFGMPAQLSIMEKAVGLRNTADAANAHASFLNAFDSAQTMIQKANGDPADFLQMVSWQTSLFSKLPKAVALSHNNAVLEESYAFITAVRQRRLSVKNYPDLLNKLLPSFRATAKVMKGNLETKVSALERGIRSKDLNTIEKAHRDFLLELSTTLTYGSRDAKGQTARIYPNLPVSEFSRVGGNE